MPVSLNKNIALNDIPLLPFWSLCNTLSSSGAERKVWFKVLHEPYSLDSNLVQLYQEAASQTIGLDHPNILKAYEFGVENSVPYVAHELFEGKTLRQVFAQTRFMSPQTVLQLIFQIARALQYAHLHGVLHGALNPDHILVNANNTLKVFNFGYAEISLYLVHERAEEKSIRFAHYFSPEQARKKPIDGRSDIYSLGIIFYHLLTGKLPHSASNLAKCLEACGNAAPKHPMVVNSAIPAELDQLIVQMLATDPDDRIPNATSIVRALEKYGFGSACLPPEPNSEDMDVESKPKYLPAWLAKRLPGSLIFLSPALVGSRRRLALALMTISAVLILIVGIIAVTSLFKGHKSEMFLYYDWLAEEEAASKNNATILSKTVPRGPETSVGSNLPGSTQQTVINRPDAGPGQISIAETGLPSVEKKSTVPANATDNFSTRPEKDRPAPTPTERKQPTTALDAGTRAPTGGLRIIATVDDKSTSATVFVNDVSKGKTNAQGIFQLGQLSAKVPHTVRIVKEGFITWESVIYVSADSIRTVRAQLVASAPAGRRLTFAQVSFADRIIISGKGSFRLPATVELSPGQYQVQYVHSATGFNWNSQMKVEQNSPEVITFDAEQLGYGFLTVSIKNAAEYGYGYVRLDDEAQNRGTTPARIKITAGPHKIRLSRDGFKAIPSDTTIVIKKGEETSLFFLLKPE